MKNRSLLYAALSVALLSLGWLGVTGLGLLVALVPLLRISGRYGPSRSEAWAMFGWCALVFGAWAAATTWWIWLAAPIGAILSVIFTACLCGGAFMLYHYASKRASKALAYTLLVAAWIAAEYLYTKGELSFPWLTLGNGFANDIRAIQWYDTTGVFGGTLWVLLCNILVYERRWIATAAVVLLPLGISVTKYATYRTPPQGQVQVAVVQANFDAYTTDYTLSEREQVGIVRELMARAPEGTRFMLSHEVVLPESVDEPLLDASWQVEALRSLLPAYPRAQAIVGATTYLTYPDGFQSTTARPLRSGGWYDYFNTALAIDTAQVQLRHKSLLVVGSEKTPYHRWLRNVAFLNIRVGDIVGQLGSDPVARVFSAPDGLIYGTAICYEGLYGGYMAGFVERGARVLFIISNDGWWGDTSGYRQLFALARLRAVELRRAIGRSANTGRSGLISPRGEVYSSLGWDERGVLTGALPLNDKITFYARHGDYIARLGCYLFVLCLLYFIAYRIRLRR